MRISLILSLAILPWWSYGFSTAPQGHFGDDRDVDVEEFFFIDATDGKRKTPLNHRRRFVVNFVPATPKPPSYPPNWMTLERAESKFSTADGAQASHQGTITSIHHSSIIAGVASGVWTVAPIFYFHCANQHILTTFPIMLLVAAMETWAMLITLDRFDASRAMVWLFIALRVCAAYLISGPVGLPFEALESTILFGSSYLAFDALATPDGPQCRTGKEHSDNSNRKPYPPTDLQRGIQW